MVHVKLVVARYNENIEWTKQFSDVVIYNKGKSDVNEYNPIILPNVGREGHTYYKYIYDNYDNLEDFTAFLQGDPFFHNPDIIKELETIINSDEYNKNFKFLTGGFSYANLHP